MMICGARSECGVLEAILIYKPPIAITDPDDPREVLHAARIDYGALSKEFDGIISGVTSLGIKIFMVDTSSQEGTEKKFFYNLMYIRDAFWAADKECVLANMAPSIRKEEKKLVKKTLEHIGATSIEVEADGAVFEGADILWISRNKVMVGVGGRTNEKGFEVLADRCKAFGVEASRVNAAIRSLHLLGSVQIVDEDLAFVRTESVGEEVRKSLVDNGKSIVEVPESEEVAERYAMNIVTVAPRKIIMAAGIPEMKGIFERAGVEIAREFKVSELIKGGGALGCALGILKRKG